MSPRQARVKPAAPRTPAVEQGRAKPARETRARRRAPAQPARPPRGSLSRDVILDAAEAICEAEGYDALSMRAVAARLGATPMALYNHFATKVELVNALLDRVLSRFVPADDLKGFARAHRKVLTDH